MKSFKFYHWYIFILSLLLLVSGCSTLIPSINKDQEQSQAAKGEGTTEEDSQKEAVSLKHPKPHTELEDILEDEGIGQYAEDRYDKEKVRNELDQFPENLSDEELYERILALVGESYRAYIDTFDQLEKVDYTQNYGELTVDVPEGSSNKNKKETSSPSMRVEILLDASGSMAGKVDGEVKMDLAKKAIQDFASSLPEDTWVSLRVYGHKGSNQQKDQELSCKETEQVYSPAPYDQTKFQQSLDRFDPTGWTPLAGAIEAAAKDLIKGPRSEGATMIYIVSDGVETCGGNPAKAASSLHQSDIEAVVNIIGFDVDNEGQQQLKKVAEAGGGSYRTVNDKDSLRDELKRHAADLNRLNNISFEKAVQNIDDSYKQDDKRNDQNHSSMVEAVNRERSRMNYALNYLLEKEKITSDNWIKVGGWIDFNRWKAVGDHADKRWMSVGNYLDKQLQENFNKVQKQWRENGRKIDELENRTRLRIDGYRINKLRLPTARLPDIRTQLNAPKPGSKLNDD